MCRIVSILEEIKESQCVLIGVGEELEAGMKVLEESSVYRKFFSKTEKEKILEESVDWMYPAMLCKAVSDLDSKRANDILRVYNDLAKNLEEKNYFIITMNMDPLIFKSNLDSNRIVAPFGSYERLQCISGCDGELYDAAEYYQTIIDKITGESDLQSIQQPTCKKCLSSLVTNTVNADKYLEKGYLEQWGLYQKWLMGTVNKKLCILELGVTMQYPKLIRWPFEKMLAYNQKAKMYRIGSLFPDYSDEPGERGVSIFSDVIKFFSE